MFRFYHILRGNPTERETHSIAVACILDYLDRYTGEVSRFHMTGLVLENRNRSKVRCLPGHLGAAVWSSSLARREAYVKMSVRIVPDLVCVCWFLKGVVAIRNLIQDAYSGSCIRLQSRGWLAHKDNGLPLTTKQPTLISLHWITVITRSTSGHPIFQSLIGNHL